MPSQVSAPPVRVTEDGAPHLEFVPHLELVPHLEFASRLSARRRPAFGTVAAALSATTLMAAPACALAAVGGGGPDAATPSAAGAKRSHSSVSAKRSKGSRSSSNAKAGTGGTTTRSSKRSAGGSSRSIPLPLTTRPLPPIAIHNGAGAYSSAERWGGGKSSLNSGAQLQLDGIIGNAHRSTHPPKYLVRRYEHAAKRYQLPWEVLAAINYLETGYKRDRSSVPVRTIRWARLSQGAWSNSGDTAVRLSHVVAHSARTVSSVPRNPVPSIAHRLVANGAHRNLARAVFRYHHSRTYVQEALTLAARITSRNDIRHQKPQRRLAAMTTMAHMLNGIGYRWAGGHTADRWMVQVGYDCSGFVSAVLHAGGYLQFPQSTQTLPGQQSLAKGVGRWVTIFDRTDAGNNYDHVIIDLNGQFWESGGNDPAGVSMVHRLTDVTPSFLQTFNVRLHPKGL